ncbi:M56 family metallopeptidase [Alteromonas confluentis]|uniref:Protein TonB n=1 Tax=Alteromonas confluentis TaxID=1656094 RepID=A0A1E7Z7K1_9ALTE|nr:M56 family metallopeptidase [Alteromonas confluentis]OFC69508.1 hypothetical protein BFC18_17440 [Alteromonas confluentis]
MTEWLIAQQYIISVAALLLIAIEKWLPGKIGALRTYQLWWLFPAMLLANNLPLDFMPHSTSGITNYVVGMTPTTTVPTSFPFLTMWGSVASLILGSVIIQYWRLSRSMSERDMTVFGTKIKTSEKVSSPLLFGIVYPTIILPADFAAQFSTSQQRLIIKHETVHLRRGDSLWNALALLTLCLFWFNPLIWLAVRAFRMSQELACDETVLTNSTKEVKVDYAKALVQCAGNNAYSSSLYPTLGDKKTMMKRLEMISTPIKTNKRITVVTMLAALVLLGNTALANMPSPSEHDDKINMATPVIRIDPVYPQQALSENIEGEVVLKFDISATGKTDNIAIVSASPAGLFDESAKTALAQWQYKPRIQGGKAMVQKDLLVKLEFRLEQEPEIVRVMPK